MAASPRAKTTTVAAFTMLIAGIQKYFANVPSLTIASKTYTPAACVAILQALVAASQAAAPLKAQWLSAVEADRQAQANNKQFVLALKQSILAMFTTASTLADFGLSPRKATDPTPATKVIAVAKRAATRRARNTKGSNQKLEVVGQVPATLAIDVQTGALSPTVPAVLPASHTPGGSQQ